MLERVMGIEPTSSAWKAEVLAVELHPLLTMPNTSNLTCLPLHPDYPELTKNPHVRTMVEGGGFEPPKAEPADLQSAPFGHSGTPPKKGKQCIF